MTAAHHPHRRPLVDIYIVATQSEWQHARGLQRRLEDIGYTVASSTNLGAGGLDPLPGDARAVVVIWPVRPELFQKPALEARAAAQRGHLVEVCAGKVRPDEGFGGPPPIHLGDWDHTGAAPAFRQLLRRLQPLCGAPPRPRLDLPAATQTAVLGVTLGVATAAIVYALGQGHHDVQTAAPAATAPVEPQGAANVRLAEPAVLAVAPPTADTPPPEGRGGPEEYDRDLGVDIATPPAPPAPLPPPPRATQGPEP
jgi:hypothetical protein